ncbi:hypothetical protein V6N11_079305 [Hibiscus sabdariffa]|uniref:Uncharacterized protein n=1 Tax=Hibiscus sabdariffa TaxID=183260 RepID=A0ABR2RV02_9ROSI
MPLPLNIRNDSQWMGVAFCCIFVNGDALKDEDIRCKVYIHRREPRHVDSSRIVLGKNFNQPVKNDHLFLRYLSRDILYPYSLKNGCGESEIENISTPDCSNHECDELESSFTYNARGKGPKVKKCGVRVRERFRRCPTYNRATLQSKEMNETIYLSVDAFFEDEEIEIAKVLCCSNFDDLNYLPNELRLLVWIGCPLRIVKQCGVRIVYQKDLEDFQLMKDMKEDSASDGSIANGSIEAEDEARPHRMQIR